MKNPQPPDPVAPSSAEAGLDEPTRHRGLAPDEIRKIPSLPGVYLMRDAQDRVLYIGKAVNLNARVHSYFTKAGDARFNVRHLMGHVARVETIITANDKEAFLLENTLIKKHQPRYNIRLRDDKTYVSVRINLSHPWPRATIVHRRGAENPRDGALYLGPYISSGAIRDTLRRLQKIFPIRSCPDHVLRNRTRPCLLHAIGRCCAPCVKPVDKPGYDEMVEATILFLKGRTREVEEKIADQMRREAEALHYERAALLRDSLASFQESTEHQGVHRHEGSDRDVVVFDQAGGHGAFVVFVYRNGILVSSRPFLVRDHGRPGEDLMEEFLARYYELETPPKELLVDPPPPGIAVLAEWLAERREAKTDVQTPQRGEKRRLVELAHENARRLLEQHLTGQASLDEINHEIMERFHLEAPPETIECFDVSTIQGFATVGSMVTFRDGEPEKARYRRYRIRTVEGTDDFASLREVLTRRFRRVVEGGDAPPGLAVIDGGKGQLAVATAVFEELGLANVPVVGMAKSRVKHRGDETFRTEERFFLPGRKNPAVFKSNSPALYLLQRARDEAHRFGITYHRELRGRRNLRSTLEEIPGVGRARARALLRQFGSLRKLRAATAEELASVPGIPADLAAAIFARLQTAEPADEAL